MALGFLARGRFLLGRVFVSFGLGAHKLPHVVERDVRTIVTLFPTTTITVSLKSS